MRSSTANNPMDQQIFLCCRSADGLDAAQLSALAKQLAWRALEQMTAQDQPTLQAAGVQLQKESSGRPLFCGTDAFVSITHTTGMAAAAVSALPLGIDIERSSRVSLHAAERMFSPQEKRWMQQTDLADPFALLWTLREAYAKWTGLGLAGLCRLEARQGKVRFSPANAHQILCSDSCCLAGSLLLGEYRLSFVAQKPLHPSPSLIVRVEENGIFKKIWKTY